MALFGRAQIMGGRQTQGGGAFDPTTISGLDMWWDTSDTATITDASGEVQQMTDKSGNGNTLTQGNGADQPDTNVSTQNGLNILNYSVDFLAKSSCTNNVWTNRKISLFMVTDHPTNVAQIVDFSLPVITNEDHQSFIVARIPTSPTFVVTLGDGANFGSLADLADWSCSVSNPDAVALWTVLVSAAGNSIAVRRNGVNQTLTNTAGTMPTSSWLAATPGTMNVRVGARQHSSGNYSKTGLIGETLVYSSLLSGTDLTNVESYLIAKWGL